MHRIRVDQWPILGIACAIAILLAGCQTGGRAAGGEGGGAGRYTLTQRFPIKAPLNHSRATVAGSVERVHKAILAGLKDLGIVPITSRVDGISATVDGFYADRMDLEINVEIVASQLSRISLRSGVFNDRERSEMVFRAIEKHLP